MRTLVVCLILVLAVASASAQATDTPSQNTGQIKGSVKDPTGAPFSGVSVVVSAGLMRREMRTGLEGEFAISGLAPGDYEVVVAAPGFASASRRVLVSSGATTTVTIALSVQFAEQTVVTAGKAGERDVQNTPAAMTVVAAREIERQQVRNVEDLARLAPSVTFSQNTGFSQLTVRGIGTNAIFTGSDPSSAVYLDGVYLARPAMVLADFLDVDRVEVLRGPQGTLYGRNAVGGAMNVVTRAPTNDVRASARFVAGNLETFRGEASISGPIVRQRLMGSVAVLRGAARGFVRDLNHTGEYLGGQDVTAAVGKLRMVLNERHALLWSADVSHQDPAPLTYAKVLAVKPGFQVDNPADLHDVRTNTLGNSRNLQSGSSLRYTGQLTPRTTLTSLTAFRKIDYDVFVDVDITELDVAASDTHEIQRQWSEELTVAYQRPGFSWLGGLFFFDDRDRQWSLIELRAARLDSRLHPTVDTTSSALFGETTVAVTSRISATAGLRYTHERKSVWNEGQTLTLDAPVTVVPGSVYSYEDKQSHDAWTPRVTMEWRARERMLTYVSATRGFKSGGFNASSRQTGLGFAPEWAWSYEAGLKTDVGRTRLNLAAFYTDYTNLQVQIAVRPGLLDISNAAAATIRGVEAEYVTDVVRPVRLGGYVNWLDARYDSYIAVGVGGVAGDVAGNRLNNAPEWTGRLWLEWSTAAGRAGTLTIRPDVTWQSTAYFTPFNDTIQRQMSYALVNLSVDLQPSRRYSMGAFVRNLGGQDYITGTFSSPPPAIGGRPGLSRQFGVEFSIRR